MATLDSPNAPSLADDGGEEEADGAEEPGAVFAAAPAAMAPVTAATLSRRVPPEYDAMVERTVTRQLQREASLGEVNVSLASDQSIDALSTDEQTVLRGATNADIEYGVPMEQQKDVKAWVSKQRQQQRIANPSIAQYRSKNYYCYF